MISNENGIKSEDLEEVTLSKPLHISIDEVSKL